MIKYNDFSVTDVAFCYYKKVDRSYRLNMNDRPHNGITLVLSGEMKMNFHDENIICAEAGDIILHRKGDTYKLCALSDTAEYIVISYLCEPDAFVDDLISGGRIYSTGEHRSRYIEHFRSADEIEEGICSFALLRATVQQIICQIMRDIYICDGSITRTYTEIAKQYVRANYDKPISVEDIAKAACCSPSYLRQLFSQKCGTSPNRYVTEVRVEKAREMLSSGLFSISEVASACGFKNVHYFSRVFKEFTKTTPGKYI